MLQLGESLGVDRLVDQLGRTTPSDRWSLAAVTVATRAIRRIID